MQTPPLLFDLNDSGIKSSVGWIAPGDGLLVMDRNGNGMIDSGAELFGDATPSYNGINSSVAYGHTLLGSGHTADGFAALAQEDSNKDGVVDSNDANWSQLKVWQDLNQDGISQSDELKTLDELGIARFNTQRNRHLELLANGNQLADLGSYTLTDGSTGACGTVADMADINLAVDTFHSGFTDVIPLTPEAQALPDMQGSGMVRGMHEAASMQTAAGQTFAATLATTLSAHQVANDASFNLSQRRIA